jgi:hypothetical protein
LLPPLLACAEEMRQTATAEEMRREAIIGERRRARRRREGHREAQSCSEIEGTPPGREGRGLWRRSDQHQRGIHATTGEEHWLVEGRQWRELVRGRHRE